MIFLDVEAKVLPSNENANDKTLSSWSVNY